MITVVLLDDHELVRRGLAALLKGESDIMVIAQLSSATTAAADIARLVPDVAIIDLSLGDGSGIDVCRDLAEQPSSTRCVVLTSHIDDRAVLAAHDAGAWGYVLKTADSSKLLAAIRMVAAGQRQLDREMRGDAERRLSGSDGARVELLTQRERDIFRLLGHGYSNRQIADELFIAEKTVKNHMSSLLARLELTSRTEAAALAGRIDSREAAWR